MKLAFAATFCLATVSAFGLQSPAKNAVQALRSKPLVGPKVSSSPMVEPIDINGDRMSTALHSTPESSDVLNVRGGGPLSTLKSMDIPLLCYFFFWYVGNYYYNITNKLALKAAGGSAGFPMTISSLQLAVGALYAMFLWVAPDARAKPTVTMDDIIRMLPVAFCFMGAHSASVFALSAGAVSFGQIVKAAEPAFAAVLSQFVYKKKVSKAKWLCLPIIIGGVILASVKELDFSVAALISACIANMFAAFKGNENKKLMETDGLKDRLGSVGNQFAVTTILGTLMSIPVVIAKEGHKMGQFVDAFKTNPIISANLIASGLWFYGYNELATMTLKKTGAVTQSVANTAKRVIVIVGVAIVLGESLDPIKLLGCAIGIGGVLLYSVIDNIVGKKD
jgi:solute carrier family 35 protein E1